MDTWKYDQRNWYPQEARTFIGNGYIGGSIPLDGHGGRGAAFTASMAGLFAGPHDTAVPVPHWLDIGIKVDGAEVNPVFVNFRQTLDLAHGTMTTAYDDAEHAVRVETETFCHRGVRNVTGYRMTVQAYKKVELELEPRLDISRCGLRPTTSPLGEGGLGWVLDYLDGGARVAQAMSLEVSGPMERRPVDSETAIGLHLRASLEAGQKRVVSGIVVSVSGPSPGNEAQTILKEASAQGYEALRQSHVAAMGELWKNFDIEAEDPFLERHARSAMFYLLCGYRQDVQWGGAPSSLASQAGWGGCVFWDTEFYMYPPLLACYPELARNTLMYRYNTLDGARRNAAAHGQEGARFAWMSRKTGIAEPGPFEAERHITTDVAYAAWWYGQSTGDKEFMDRYGRQLIYEAALQTASLASPNPAGRGWDINGVIGPDEHVMDHYVGAPVNNSAMTNAYAKWLLETAPTVCPQVTAEQRRQWGAIAAGLPLLRDEARGIYLEYDGYNGHPIKQADIGHMFFPLCVNRDPAEIRRNIEYYADRERETGLFLLHSPFVYAAALSRAGDARGVHRFLVMSDRNHTGPFELPRESNYATSAVVTGSGAFLGLLIYGLLGIENSGEKLRAHPCIAEEVGKISLSGIYFRGERYRIAAGPGSFTLGPV